MKTALMILGALAGIALAGLVFTYNRLIRARNQMREGWSGIEVQLKRRHDLVPSLVECVRGYQRHEQKLLEEVVRERTAAQDAVGAKDCVGVEKSLSSGLSRLVALAESYPDLKADENFRDLMGQLVEVEDQIQSSRRYYNGSVRDLNNAIESIPSNLVAHLFGFQLGEFFEVETASDRLPPNLASSLRN